MKYLRSIITVLALCMFDLQVHGHGFGPDTSVTIRSQYKTYVCGKLVKQSMEVTQAIEKIYQNPIRNIQAKSHDELSFDTNYHTIKAAGISTTNCYIKIEFNDDCSNFIECSPTQTFYLLGTEQWVSADQLKPGDILFSENKLGTKISNVVVIQKPFTIYTLEIKKFHTFLVGKDRILTHNILLAPSLFLSLSLSFGEGALVGSSAGGTFGPLTMGAGLALGGIIGIITACTSQDRKKVEYHVEFDVNQLARKGTSKKEAKPNKKSGGNKNPDKKDPDKDPDDKRKKIDWKKTTNKQDREDAEKLGYKETKNPPFDSKNKLSFKKDQTWITADRTGHNGGRWKMFDNTGERIATCDKNLNFIKN